MSLPIQYISHCEYCLTVEWRIGCWAFYFSFVDLCKLVIIIPLQFAKGSCAVETAWPGVKRTLCVICMWHEQASATKSAWLHILECPNWLWAMLHSALSWAFVALYLFIPVAHEVELRRYLFNSSSFCYLNKVAGWSSLKVSGLKTHHR